MTITIAPMQRVAELRADLGRIRAELKQLLDGNRVPSNGGYPVSQVVDWLKGIDDRLEETLYECGLIQEDEL